MKIYVGNLPRELTEDDLRHEFEAFGKVESVAIVKDRYSGQPRGFGFVEMPTKSEAVAALAGLKGKVVQERTLDISEARPRPEGGRGGGQFRSGGRSGGSRGGFGGGKGRRY
ncbi:MAG: RNA-binding protein [Dehalococcoidia bacterium]|nr:RNA-binding protein [Dehalococcoidia bacterium]